MDKFSYFHNSIAKYAARFGKSDAVMAFRIFYTNLEVSLKHSQAQQWSSILQKIVKLIKFYLLQELNQYEDDPSYQIVNKNSRK